ncbi:MAG: 50S ribosomal protein L3 N(5)-glutamine methyltransferase [Pseudomonadota bacterium]
MVGGDANAAHRLLGEVIPEVAAALDQAGVYFGHGTDNAMDEACWLTAAALGEDPLQAPLADRRVSPEEYLDVQRWLERRVKDRLPLAYMTGIAWFAGHRFYVDPHVLIPRSPIAELINEGLSLWPLTGGDRVLDLCTGSGCIGIAVALAFSDIEVTATDLSADALAVAQRNVALHRVGDRVELLKGDLFEPVAGQFALIISNPPYVSRAEYNALPAEYGHEPGIALQCGGAGLDLPLQILHDAPDYLTEHGQLILETGNSADALQDALGDLPLTWLSFEHGGSGILTASRQELVAWRQRIAVARQELSDVQ